MSIADDPAQWTTPVKDNHLGKAARDSKAHTLDDYHEARDTLFRIMSKAALSNSALCRDIFTMAEMYLSSTPKDGNDV